MADILNQGISQLPITQYNLANNTKWIFNIPVARLFYVQKRNEPDGQYLDYPLLCKSVSFPEFKIGTTSLNFLGYNVDVSTRQNLTQKKLSIKFLISENWLQYLMLLKWFELEDYTRYNYNRDSETIEIDLGNGIKRTVNSAEYHKQEAEQGKDPYYSTQGPMVPCNLYLMDNFNKRICTINFDNCWLSNISNVNLSYEKTDGTEIECTFELTFYKYNIIINDEELKDFIPDGINTK